MANDVALVIDQSIVFFKKEETFQQYSSRAERFLLHVGR
jgi:hypothetical protein